MLDPWRRLVVGAVGGRQPYAASRIGTDLSERAVPDVSSLLELKGLPQTAQYGDPHQLLGGRGRPETLAFHGVGGNSGLVGGGKGAALRSGGFADAAEGRPEFVANGSDPMHMPASMLGRYQQQQQKLTAGPTQSNAFRLQLASGAAGAVAAHAGMGHPAAPFAPLSSVAPRRFGSPPPSASSVTTAVLPPQASVASASVSSPYRGVGAQPAALVGGRSADIYGRSSYPAASSGSFGVGFGGIVGIGGGGGAQTAGSRLAVAEFQHRLQM